MPRLSKIGAAALAAFGWTSGGVSAVTASVLIVGGGGGAGGNTNAANGGRTTGGGGGGGVLTGSSATLNPTLSYTVVVGAGGSGGIAGGGTAGTNGSNSTFLSVIANGGGGGGAAAVNALSGGSGGGGGNYLSNPGTSNQSSYSGYTAYGNSGGTGTDSAPNYGSGGGGGAGGAGANSTANVGGNGGAGISSSISGSSLFYAGGGGGAAYGSGSTNQGTGGSGVGGDARGDANGLNGAESRGGGGGGCGHLNASTNASYAGGNGGSGVVIISYAGAQQFGGGVVTSVGGNTIHTFTTSGTLSPLSSLTASYLIVAGGGGGGAGGGGAGGMVTGSGSTLDTNSIYLITVGAGGSGPSNTSGSNSSISIVSTTAIGGGFGDTSGTAGNGGSGGGGASPRAGGTGTAGQGNNGGSAVGTSSPFPMAGGGGAGAVGGNATGSTSGNGGNGLASSISGSSVTYAGGGGGASTSQGATAGTGGTGGGGNGATASVAAQNGGTNLGGGGGGYANQGGSAPGNGGSGIVIISYPGSTPQMAGGTVTAAGGNIIHTFTSSGYLTPITNLNNSLRFRSSAGAYLSRTPTSAGDRRTATFSFWIKRGILSAEQAVYSLGAYPTNLFEIFFLSDNTLLIHNTPNSTTRDLVLTTTQVFRDPSAWYHIVVAIDTTQATSSDRAKLYVNGSQVTAFSTATYPNQNTNLNLGSVLPNQISRRTDNNYLQDAYLADFYHIDGQALTPNSFGAFNGQGVWQPIRYGGSYGTNGFYLPFNQGSSTFAGSFNGSNQYLSVADNAAFDYGSGEFTIEGWIYSTSAASSSGTGLFSKRANNGIFAPIQVLYFNSQLILYASTSGSSWAISATQSGSLSLNTWYHFAVVRIGNTITLYVNGTSVASGTVSGALMTNSSALTIAAEAASGTGLFAGQISNFRIVKGAAIYNSNFVPPVSPLTNVSGTSLLTLQSATVTDNSSNAFAITNNGSVTLAANTIVFANPKSLCLDQSPAQNNWTPNNISNTVGSTYDSMTDVPTNTSATVANYCVLNPLSVVGGASTSNANLTGTTATTNGAVVYGTMQIPSSGKWYWEVTPTSDGDQGFVGIEDQAFNTSPPSPLRVAYYAANGEKYVDSTNTAYGATWTNNDVIGVAVDVDSGSVTFYKNNTSQGAITYNITGKVMFPMFRDGGGSTSMVFNANFGQRPFAYTPPAGFVALNTFNLPTPTIGATPATTANKYFNIINWTGDGVNPRTLSGVGFQPDFVWAKLRSGAASHTLYDAVRGVGNVLYSDLTAAEANNNPFGYLSAFNSDGFVATAGSTNNAYFNTNGSTYVAWNWNGGGSNATNTAGSITSTVRANTTAGFSIVKYTGTGSNATVGHGLGVAPAFIIVRNYSITQNFIIGHKNLWDSNQNSFLLFTTSAVITGNSAIWNSTRPTSSVINIGTDSGTNGNGNNHIAWCWAEVPGYSAFGSYTGNGSTDGPFIYTGFRPKYILTKKTNASGTQWNIWDSTRNTYNVAGSNLWTDSSEAETTSDASYGVDILSNGFKLRNSSSGRNANGDTYIYAAFAESPFKYANAR